MMESLDSRSVLPDLKANSKKQALREMARRAAELTGLADRDIMATMLERERLGTTGIGGGIAIPHACLDGLETVTGLFARLERPVDFDAVDDEPVDLVFMLLAPAGGGAEHLKALARVSRALRDPARREKLRGATSADAILALLMEAESSQAA